LSEAESISLEIAFVEKNSEIAKTQLVNSIFKEKLEKIIKSDTLKTIKLNKLYQSALKKVNDQRGKYTTEMQYIYTKLHQSNLQTENIRNIAHDKLCQELSLLYNSININTKNSINSLDREIASPLSLNLADLILPAHIARLSGFDNSTNLITPNENKHLEGVTNATFRRANS
jgi:hypothetical protein